MRRHFEAVVRFSFESNGRRPASKKAISDAISARIMHPSIFVARESYFAKPTRIQVEVTTKPAPEGGPDAE